MRKYSKEDQIAAFWQRVLKTDTCWLWTNKKNYKGYGIFYTSAQPNKRAHVFSWELFRGDVPKGLIVRHSCDVRNCVNPDHLLLGTNADNTRDMVERGRALNGSKSPLAEFSDSDIAEIRKLAASGVKQARLVEKFNSTSASISRIVNRRTYDYEVSCS